MTVTLFGGSGTMGFEAFKELWKRRDQLNIQLLLLDKRRERNLFYPYLKKSKGRNLSITWGDATVYSDVKKAISGTDWILDAMAFISPQADYYREKAKAINIQGIANIVKAIGEEPDGNERIPLIYTGTVASTGDRLDEIRFGRTGDPLKPSIYDTYAVTKIAGERIVLESDIKRWVSLRMTFIMPTSWKKLMQLYDPILFHQPLNTHMENITDRDAGFGLVNCLDIDKNSDFWCRIYNMGGGPEMRCTAFNFLKMNLGISGLDPEYVYERKWFALRNFHMQYYYDSSQLNSYLHYWRDSLDDWKREIGQNRPFFLKIIKSLCSIFPYIKSRVERETYERMRTMAEDHSNGTAYWYNNKNLKRIRAFYGSIENYESIGDWKKNLDYDTPPPPPVKLDHGYDELKELLNEEDLQKAARFRGGKYDGSYWNGDLMEKVPWTCSNGHSFSARVNTILKGGHWCPLCAPPDWDYDRESQDSPFFRQVWHGDGDNAIYTEADCDDISGKRT